MNLILHYFFTGAFLQVVRPSMGDVATLWHWSLEEAVVHSVWAAYRIVNRESTKDKKNGQSVNSLHNDGTLA